ncbi:type 2 lanthipeptide synthetase LanM family protein [Terracidiphilus gabretensis]|uniref:type 2 lanthipeptide synthetase LanM family protein n=1 Tax=Terracidiphilus gabretensis TaxID=1577687 RepID=UPI00071BF1D4|nr:type 2 lanthipeptide synthetase LanM family protein [Terracidiphilus gabretensis]
MRLSAEVSRDIAARASTLEERLATGAFAPHDAVDPEKIEQRIERWKQVAAQGDGDRFAKLLALQGISEEQARRALGPIQPEVAIPGWIELLNEGLAAAAAPPAERSRFRVAEDPWPFEQIVEPFVQAASCRLRQMTGSAYQLLSDGAHAGMERKLLSWLVNSCSSALILEFSLFRMKYQPALFRGRLPQATAEPANRIHELFIAQMQTGGLVPFFEEYCVLARAVAKLMSNWIDAGAEFLTRLASDLDALRASFQPEGALGKVERLAAGLSDPHHGGRTVTIVTFTSGLNIVYKPKSLETEEAYSQLLEWLNAAGTTLPLRGLNVLVRPGYGWVEFVEHGAPADDLARARFYKRSGMLLCLFYLLESNDVHSENLIAAGEHPMLIDAETLIVPSLESGVEQESDSWAESRALSWMNASVLRVGMLPWWRPHGGQLHDPSALGGVGGEEVQAMVWQGVATDDLTRQAVKVRATRNGNVPFASGDQADPGRFVEDIVSGFREMYALLTAQREALLSAGGPLEALADAPMRLVFRDTATYFSILKNSMDAGMLRDGADRSVGLEVLTRVLGAAETHGRFSPFLKAEKRSLSDLDIPFFTVSPRRRNLDLGPAGMIENCFVQSGYERVLDRFRRLGADDLERQIQIIRGSFSAKIASHQTSPANGNVAATQPCRMQPASESELVDEAVRIADRILAEAVRGDDGSATWISISRRPNSGCYNFGPLGPGMFDGVSGIMLFLASIHAATGIDKYRETALAAIKPIERLIAAYELRLRSGRKNAAHDLPLGLTGLGSIVYGCARAAKLLDDETPLQVAHRAASLIRPQFLNHETPIDIFGGLAGAILGLLSLQAEINKQIALQCGDLILSGSAGEGAGQHAMHRKMGSGFASGRQGVAYAFERLFEATGETRFLHGAEAVREAAPIVAEDVPSQFDGQELPGRVERFDALLEEARRSKCTASLETARRQAACMMRQAANDGGYRLHPHLPAQTFLPGLFEGVSGIGYEFLRAATPDRFPSVFLWN